jgi:hypothetical protein
MELIKYRDSYDKDYSWFWVHKLDGVEKVVSKIFDTEQEAMDWDYYLKKEMNESIGNIK